MKMFFFGIVIENVYVENNGIGIEMKRDTLPLCHMCYWSTLHQRKLNEDQGLQKSNWWNRRIWNERKSLDAWRNVRIFLVSFHWHMNALVLEKIQKIISTIKILRMRRRRLGGQDYFSIYKRKTKHTHHWWIISADHVEKNKQQQNRFVKYTFFEIIKINQTMMIHFFFSFLRMIYPFYSIHILER
jgi:hypothetical protein